MRLLTHNALRNNSAAAKGRGFPLRIEATEVRVDDGAEIDERALLFVRRTLAMLDWPALVQVPHCFSSTQGRPVMTRSSLRG
jgi:hypothetical protein